MFSALFILLFVAWAPNLDGQVAIIPLLQEVSLNRGARTTFQIRIANRGSAPLSFSMKAHYLDVTTEGLPSAVEEKTERGCVEWITFAPEHFELVPDSVQVVEGTVRAPKDVAGGYYAFITCNYKLSQEPLRFGESDKSSAVLDLDLGVSSILLVTVRSSANIAQLRPDSLVLKSGMESSEGGSVDPFSTGDGGGGWSVLLPVENTGNVHTIAEGTVSLWTEDMRLVERTALQAGRGYVLPGKVRNFKAQGEKALHDGSYLVNVYLRTREGRLIQGSTAYSVLRGKTIAGVPSDKIRAMMEASTPKFSLSDRLLEFDVPPNGKRTQGIKLANYTSDTLHVSARLETWTIDDKGSIAFNPDPSEVVKPCVSWVTVSPVPVTIPPKRFKTVKVQIAAPEELDGEYYGAVVFHTPSDLPNLPVEWELARTALLTVSSKKTVRYEATIESVDHKDVSPLMRTFTVDIRNEGNVHCYASGKLTLLDKEWKQTLEPVAFGGHQDYILPLKSRKYVVPCPGELKPGMYSAVVEVKYSDEQSPVVEEYKFRSGD